MKTVFLFAANYVYTSDFLRTSYLECLASKYNVVVFLPSQAFEKAVKPYPILPNVVYQPWDTQYPKFWDFFTKLLRYSLARKFDDEPVLKRNYAKNLKGYKRRILRAISYLFPKSFFNADLFSKVEIKLLPLSLRFRELCEHYKPSLILTSSPGFNPYDAEAITFAKKLGILSVAVNFSWDNFHNGAHSIRKPDFLILWNSIMKQEAISMHSFDPKHIFVSGPIRFDHYFQNTSPLLSREDFLRSKKLDPSKKTVLVSTVTDGNYPLESDFIRFLTRARERQIVGAPNIFIRLHPKDNLEKYKEFQSHENVHVEEAGKRQLVNLGSTIELDEEDLLNMKHTLLYSDVVVNYASTVSLEAFAFDKPVINIGFPEKYLDAYDFRHYKPITEARAVRLAKTLCELVQDVNMYIKGPDIDCAYRKNIFDRFLTFSDGHSYKRSVDYLGQILNNENLY